MSRSYAKTAKRWGCGKTRTWMRHYASSVVRNKLKNSEEIISQPSLYKKMFETWKICDFGRGMPLHLLKRKDNSNWKVARRR